jgi:hypothetical protein
MPKAPKRMSFHYSQLRIPEVALHIAESRKVPFGAVLLPAEGYSPNFVRPRILACRSDRILFTRNSNTVFVSAKIRGSYKKGKLRGKLRRTEVSIRHPAQIERVACEA